MKKKILFLIILLLFLVTSCVKSSPNQTCTQNEDCLSNRCVNKICEFSQESEKCNYDFDCAEGLICESSTCVYSQQGGRCTSDENCKEESNFCYIEEGQYNGKCIKNNFICKKFYENLGPSTFVTILGIIVILAVILGVGGGLVQLLGLPVFSSPSGITVYVFTIIVGGIWLYFYLRGFCL